MERMFDVSRRTMSQLVNRVRPQIECLEGRLCPAKGFAITEFSAVALPNHVAKLTGTVIDLHPELVQLTFTGAVKGGTSPDVDGNFSFTTTEATLGMIYVDGVNFMDMTAENQDALLVPRPVIDLELAYGEQKTVTLSGSVEDIDAAGLIVTFKGKVTGSVLTDAAGNFEFTTAAIGLGDVKAFAVNLWGLRSIPASVTIANLAPEIVGLVAEKSLDGIWSFSGKVKDESPAGLVVYFSNIPEMQGISVTTGSQGEFCFTVELHVTVPAQVHADVTDWWGLSDSAWVNIAP